jgi:hypothetical protein
MWFGHTHRSGHQAVAGTAPDRDLEGECLARGALPNRIALAASDADFVDPKDLAIPSPLPSWDLVDGIQDKTGTQTYSQSIRGCETQHRSTVRTDPPVW